MVNSILKQSFKILPLISCCLLFSFKTKPDGQQLLTWSNTTLSHLYDPSAEPKLKKWELTITDDYFLRLRKTFQNGKQEYFSCQLRRFSDIDYSGTTVGGIIKINTHADDVIVQTYNDRKGDIDSMATSFNIPVKNIQPEQLDSLRNALMYFRNAPAATIK